MTAGGVILPNQVVMEEDAKLGVVIAMGEDVDLDVQVGQTVIFNHKTQVTEVPLGDESVMFVAQPSIHAVLS